MKNIYRYQRIEGKYIPGIIKNGNYFFTKVALYEDGVINCWEKVEFQDIKEVIEKDWLCCEIPNGKNISIFEVGDYIIKSAKWEYNKDTYYKSIIENIKELNPYIEEINKIVKKIPKEDYKKEMMVTSTPFKMEYKSKLYSWFDGDDSFIFYNFEGKLYLTTLIAYEDKTFKVGMLEEKYFSLEEIKEMFDKNILTTEVKDRFFIKDFAEIEIESINYFVEKSQKFKEIEDMMKKVCGEETTLELCREAYFEYLADPCDYTKEKLRKAYEAVPEHERMYLGDMDSKDWDYRRILYSNKKREV